MNNLQNDFNKTEEELKKELDAKTFEVARNKGTEMPFSGEYVHTKEKGKYACKVCGQMLFASDTKFDSGTGWPSFDNAVEGSVKHIDDTSHAMRRTEVVCSRCDSHLGHVFNDGPTETGKRYCMNSVCLDLQKE